MAWSATNVSALLPPGASPYFTADRCFCRLPSTAGFPAMTAGALAKLEVPHISRWLSQLSSRLGHPIPRPLQIANATLQALLAGGAAVSAEQVQPLVDICGAAAPALANMSQVLSSPDPPTAGDAAAAEQALARVFDIVSGVQTALLASLVRQRAEGVNVAQLWWLLFPCNLGVILGHNCMPGKAAAFAHGRASTTQHLASPASCQPFASIQTYPLALTWSACAPMPALQSPGEVVSAGTGALTVTAALVDPRTSGPALDIPIASSGAALGLVAGFDAVLGAAQPERGEGGRAVHPKDQRESGAAGGVPWVAWQARPALTWGHCQCRFVGTCLRQQLVRSSREQRQAVRNHVPFMPPPRQTTPQPSS